MFILLAGLWFVQIVYAKRYQSNLIKQSVRMVGTPAIRGKLDRQRQRPCRRPTPLQRRFVLEDLQNQFDAQYKANVTNYGRREGETFTNKGRLSISTATRHGLQLDPLIARWSATSPGE